MLLSIWIPNAFGIILVPVESVCYLTTALFYFKICLATLSCWQRNDFFFFTVLFLGGDENHTGSTTPSQKENAMKIKYISFPKKGSHTEPKFPWNWAGADSVVRKVFNKSMEEKTSTRLSLFIVTESQYLARSLTVSIDLNEVNPVVERLTAEFVAMPSPSYRRRKKEN